MPDFATLLPGVDARFERFRGEAGVPGVAWGVVSGGRLAHAGGAGTIRDGEDRRPDVDSVFRIASMTKSFTAAAVLLLRDEGGLALDEPVATYVPELAAWPPPTADSPPVTVRHLLTMSAGLPTDDPWGDRQQGLPLDEFSKLLAAGPTFAWPPGTRYDYSNLGYGILGRVITAVAGAEFRDVVRDRLLARLGMTATAFAGEDVAEAKLAHGYVRRGDALVREGTDQYGALASMGGVFSSVRDLARWVAGFTDAFPARDHADDAHPLRRATRREMQQVHRWFAPDLPAHSPDGEPVVIDRGYGFGLFLWRDPDTGTTIGHAGGYPGFGSHMVWHPATGLGVIGLGNLRYAPMRPVVAEVLATLVRAEAVPRRRVTPLPATAALRPVVDGLIDRWDDGVADAAFAMNMDLDEPRELRRGAVERIAADLGPFRPDPSRPVASERPADLAWWLRGERGWARVSIFVSPEPSPRIQSLEIRPVPDPSPELVAVAERVLTLAAQPGPEWPDDVALAEDVDRAVIERSLRAGSARFGTMTLGLLTAGDGRTTATWDLATERGRATLAVGLDADTGAVTAVSLLVADREEVAEGW